MQRHTEIQTLFTEPTGRTILLFNAEAWTRIRLELQTAGPVSVGTRQDLSPLLGGKGMLLPPGFPIEFIIPKGDRFYYLTETINRVNYTTEAIAYGTTGVGLIAEVRDAILGRLKSGTAPPPIATPQLPNPAAVPLAPTKLPMRPAFRVPRFKK